MTTSAIPAPEATARAQATLMDALFGSVWPERSAAARPRLVAAALGAGLLAALVLPFRDAGLGSFVVLMCGCGVVAAADPRLRTPYHLAAGGLCTLLVGTVVVRDALWVVVLCLLSAAAVGISTLVHSRTVVGIVLAGAAVPLAALRGLPWLGRSVTATPVRSWVPVVRTAGLSALLLAVFGLLFASADALFATWVGVVVPDLDLASAFLRGFVLVVFGGLTLTGVYLALNPPAVGSVELPLRRPVRRAWEWRVPVLLVVAVFVLFLAAQLAAMFGGHAYVRRTTGLTYADYVHQGFGQLTVATALTLLVVAVAARLAPRSDRRDRLALRAVLGTLCLLTLVVVASALYRMHVYEQAYGFTRLRLTVSVFEAWLGLVLVLVMAAGVRFTASWVPRAVLLSGAVSLLVLAAANPDALIARHNIQRFQATGRVDAGYLAELSADAVPTLAAAGADLGCVPAAQPTHDDWLEWNLGRARATHRAGTNLDVPALDLCG